MTDTPAHIDADAFLRFAAARKLTLAPCPVCGTGDFAFFFNPALPNNSLSMVEVDVDAPSITAARAGFYLSLECKNCGNARLFKRKTISDWLRENPA